MSSQASGYIATTVGPNIRAARKAAKLTQRALAEKLDTDAMLVSKWERGRHRPSDGNLAAVALHTRRPIDWFYVDHGHKPGRKAAA